MNPKIMPDVEATMPPSHLINMFNSDQHSMFSPGGVSWTISSVPPVIVVSWPTDPADQGPPAFWSAFADGLHAPTLLYSGNIVLMDSSVLTTGEYFSTVGSYFSESIPMVVSDERADTKAKETA